MEFGLKSISQCPHQIPINISWSYFSIFRIYNLNSYTQQLAELPHWFSDTQTEDYYGRKGQVEVTKTPSNSKNSKPKLTPHSWRHFIDFCHHQVFEHKQDL